MQVPFVKVPIGEDSRKYILQAFDSGCHAGGGVFTKRCHRFMEKHFGIKKVLLTTSCTDALEMAAFLIDGRPGGEFIVPSYTFSSTANAFASKGMIPVFVDIRKDTLNIDETKIEELITPKTKAIVPIHYAGIPAEMDAINEIAELHNLVVIEDAAQAVNSKYKGRFAGSLSQLGTFSFHASKAYSCGEGGALTMNDEKYFVRSEFLWEKGTDRSLVIKGSKNKYRWVDYGSSFLPSDILAAMLFANLQSKDDMQEARKKLYLAYKQTFRDLEDMGLRTPTIPREVESNFHAFFLVFPEPDQRAHFLENAILRNVIPYIGYVPLHSSPMGKILGGAEYHLPVTDYITERVVRLPFYLMTEKEIDYACSVLYDSAKEALRKRKSSI